MIKFGTPVIDALRLCYVAEPSLLQDLSSLNVKSNRKFGDFTLTRVAADRFEFFFIISFDTEGAQTELGSLKYGRYDAADSLYVYYQVQNEILYDRELLDQALCFPDLLGLYFNNFTAIDIALDHKKNFSAIIKRMMRNEKITTILNGKAIKDRKELKKGLDFNFSSSLSRLHCQTITLKQAKAARNKSKGITIQSYDKKAEIETQSGKDYILNQYGNPLHHAGRAQPLSRSWKRTSPAEAGVGCMILSGFPFLSTAPKGPIPCGQALKSAETAPESPNPCGQRLKRAETAPKGPDPCGQALKHRAHTFAETDVVRILEAYDGGEGAVALVPDARDADLLSFPAGLASCES